MTGVLYVVPTPIGNLEDITLRGLKVLREADIIACEDTRHTVKLLNHYDIHKPLVSFYSQNQVRRLPQIIAEINSGKRVALVSDSGTPGISDPGFFLIREALAQNIQVIPLPGPSAVITALVGSGLPTDGFVFLGFLRRKPGKLKKELQEAAQIGKTVVFYESPYRVRKTLALCGEVFPPGTQVALARELTKVYEEFIRGSLQDVARQLETKETRGEFVVLIYPDEGSSK